MFCFPHFKDSVVSNAITVVILVEEPRKGTEENNPSKK
jgi:hypothetical protein